MTTKNISAFVAALFLSAFFAFGINITSKALTSIFLWNELAKHPEILAAQTLQDSSSQNARLKVPHLKEDAVRFQTQARSALSVFVGEDDSTKTLYEKDASFSLPIASITKLMTALVSLEQYQLNKKITISKKAAEKEEPIGNFKTGEVITMHDLLYSMLIESSNKAAQALAGALDDENFLRAMNAKAKEVGLENTFFADPAGVDPNGQTSEPNVSNARDLAKLAQYLMENDPRIFDILSTKEYVVRNADGTFHHVAKNTDDLLESSTLALRVMGGKTGWTPLAKGCLLLVAEAPQNNGYLINVVLASDARFDDMKNLIGWVVASYDF